jgi:cephalosporin hydroxylase
MNETNLEAQGRDAELQHLSREWAEKVGRHKYTYNFTWMGRPIIQLPQDIVAMQELIFRIKPAVIVETGVAHGGSLVLYASMLELLGGDREVIGVDIDIRAHNRAELDAHPMRKRIRLIQGSSVSPETVAQVKRHVGARGPVLVTLDSNHTHEHVLHELHAYSPLVTQGSYLVVFDTLIEEMPDHCFPDRPWKKGNSPRSAVREFLGESRRFEVDEQLEAKLLITACPGGWLKCVAP